MRWVGSACRPRRLLLNVVANSRVARCKERLQGSVLEIELLINEQPCQKYGFFYKQKALNPKRATYQPNMQHKNPKVQSLHQINWVLCASCKQLQGTKNSR